VQKGDGVAGVSCTLLSARPLAVVKVIRSSRWGSGDGGVYGVGNLAHFMHKRTLFNMNNTIFSLTAGGSNRSKGLSPMAPLLSPLASSWINNGIK